MSTKSKSSEIKIIRTYEAPVQAVWKAWTDPKQVAQWWGPRGFTLTTHSKDLRVGGSWRYTMHGPDGIDYPNVTKYLEVEEYSRLVYDHGATDERPPLFQVKVIFTEIQGMTHMDMRMILPTPEAAEETRKLIKKANGNSTWDRLAEYLAKVIHGKELFVMNRSFDASVQLMFEFWTHPNHLIHWATPTGFEMSFLKADIKPGGGTFYLMTGPKNEKMYGCAKYLEIKRPFRIVYTQQFCDENETLSRHPMAPTWPETLLTTITLTEEETDKTRVTLAWEPYGAVTLDEIETFIQAKAGMNQGWAGSFDQLDSYLIDKKTERAAR